MIWCRYRPSAKAADHGQSMNHLVLDSTLVDPREDLPAWETSAMCIGFRMPEASHLWANPYEGRVAHCQSLAHWLVRMLRASLAGWWRRGFGTVAKSQATHSRITSATLKRSHNRRRFTVLRDTRALTAAYSSREVVEEVVQGDCMQVDDSRGVMHSRSPIWLLYRAQKVYKMTLVQYNFESLARPSQRCYSSQNESQASSKVLKVLAPAQISFLVDQPARYH
jgi:hypothetical protein